MAKRSWMVAALLVLAGTGSPAQAITAGELQEICRINNAQCIGYVQGHVDLHMNYASQGFVNQDAYCWPATATYDQGRQIFIKWAADNPAHLHLPASLMMSVAFIASFPCATPTAEPTPQPRSRRRGF